MAPDITGKYRQTACFTSPFNRLWRRGTSSYMKKWTASTLKSPREIALKSRVRELLQRKA